MSQFRSRWLVVLTAVVLACGAQRATTDVPHQGAPEALRIAPQAAASPPAATPPATSAASVAGPAGAQSGDALLGTLDVPAPRANGTPPLLVALPQHGAALIWGEASKGDLPIDFKLRRYAANTRQWSEVVELGSGQQTPAPRAAANELGTLAVAWSRGMHDVTTALFDALGNRIETQSPLAPYTPELLGLAVDERSVTVISAGRNVVGNRGVVGHELLWAQRPLEASGTWAKGALQDARQSFNVEDRVYTNLAVRAARGAVVALVGQGDSVEVGKGDSIPVTDLAVYRSAAAGGAWKELTPLFERERLAEFSLRGFGLNGEAGVDFPPLFDVFPLDDGGALAAWPSDRKKDQQERALEMWPAPWVASGRQRWAPQRLAQPITPAQLTALQKATRSPYSFPIRGSLGEGGGRSHAVWFDGGGLRSSSRANGQDWTNVATAVDLVARRLIDAEVVWNHRSSAAALWNDDQGMHAARYDAAKGSWASPLLLMPYRPSDGTRTIAVALGDDDELHVAWLAAVPKLGGRTRVGSIALR